MDKHQKLSVHCTENVQENVPVQTETAVEYYNHQNAEMAAENIVDDCDVAAAV